MTRGISILSVIPLRKEAAHASEMVSQLLFGESFDIAEDNGKWLFIKLHHDGYEGWVEKKQVILLNQREWDHFPKTHFLAADPIQLVTRLSDNFSFPVLMGSVLPGLKDNIFKIGHETFQFEGSVVPEKNKARNKKQIREQICGTAVLLLNAPYLWGGRSVFGIDCSGFSQMVYRICGLSVMRDASQQATQGEALSFIEESEPGDLAFFDNEEGRIIHVGILLPDNRIIHASGQVRIDTLDHFGIYDASRQQYSHRLRLLKNYLG